MTTIVDAPDGKRYRIPAEATQEQVARFLSSLKAPEVPVGAISPAAASDYASTPEATPAPKSATEMGPAGEGRAEPAAPSKPIEQTTGPAFEDLARHGRMPTDAKGQANERSGEDTSAGLDLESVITRMASRLSGAARRDPDLRRMAKVEVDLVVQAGSDCAIVRVFQRAPRPTSQEASP